ncbi:MAG: hypothetical protein ACXVL8_05555, partial [Acidimicrobiia bacterium]
LMYVLWGNGSGEQGNDLREKLLREIAPALFAAGARALTVDVHDSEAAQAPPPMPTPEGEEKIAALVSVWIDAYDRRAPFERALELLGCRYAGYLVVESVYDDYGTTEWSGPRDWPDGDRSPGVLTVALIHRPVGVEYADWIERWHGTQSPLSAELQPRIRYVRNEVVRAVTDDAPEVHGIVEEAWTSAEVVADPMLFFNSGGDPAVMQANLEKMLESVNACLDLSRFRTATMSEYLVRSV